MPDCGSGYDNLEMELLHRLRSGEIKPATGAKRAVRAFDNATAFRLLAAHRESAARQRAIRSNEDAETIVLSINAKLEKMRQRMLASPVIDVECNDLHELLDWLLKLPEKERLIQLRNLNPDQKEEFSTHWRLAAARRCSRAAHDPGCFRTTMGWRRQWRCPGHICRRHVGRNELEWCCLICRSWRQIVATSRNERSGTLHSRYRRRRPCSGKSLIVRSRRHGLDRACRR